MSGGQWMVVLIVAIAIFGSILKARYKTGEAGTGHESSADALRMREEIRALKDRIAVLERVITDNEGSLRLDREIERLRDDNRV